MRHPIFVITIYFARARQAFFPDPIRLQMKMKVLSSKSAKDLSIKRLRHLQAQKESLLTELLQEAKQHQ